MLYFLSLYHRVRYGYKNSKYEREAYNGVQNVYRKWGIMPTFRYHKLVRDNIWDWHIEAGHTPTGEQLSGDALRAAMAEKLHEEADEVKGAKTRDELVEEIADVQQLLDDLCTSQAIGSDELRAVQRHKRDKKGGFLAGHYIETVKMPDEDDKWAQYCRADPSKYPEMDGQRDEKLHQKSDTGSIKQTGEPPKLPTGPYRHYKGGMYTVTGLACHSETLEWLVVYVSYERKARGLPSVWVRPYEMFVETIEIDGMRQPRFAKINLENN